ncbi:hypothetical protein D9M71_798720 [compost metagenome]
MTAKGDLTSSGGRTEIRLSSFAATPKQVALKLAAPTVIAIENGTVRLNALTIQASRGTIAVSGTAGDGYYSPGRRFFVGLTTRF